MAERTTKPSPTVTWIVVGVIVVCLAGFFAMARSHTPDTEFGGADAQAVEALEDDGIEPWFSPLFEPESAEIESGLFALQAALGGAVLGYAIGRLQSRHTAEGRLHDSSPQHALKSGDTPAADTQPPHPGR